MGKIAQHAVIENSGLALGKIGRQFKNYYVKKVMTNQPNINPSKIIKTFKPLYDWDNSVNRVGLLNPKTKSDVNGMPQKVFDLSSVYRKIGDIVYNRRVGSVIDRNNESSSSSYHSASRNSRQDSRNRGP